jgi:uncharacterized protein
MKHVGQIRLPFDHDARALDRELERRGVVGPYRILKKSLDARDKRRICWVYAVGLPEPVDDGPPIFTCRRQPDPWPLIVGSGPGGLFAAHWLALHGVRAVILEQGEPMPSRLRTMARFVRTGELDPRSNVCFGAGGAGAYSDGKLMTRIRSPHLAPITEALVRFGAPEEVRYLYDPHLGSNGIRRVLARLLESLEAAGSRLRYGRRLASLELRGGALEGAVLDDGEIIPAPRVLLATGHSASPLYEELARLGVALRFKPFAVGARLEHPAPLIDGIQHGRHAGHPALGAAQYRLAHTWSEGAGKRAVYTFCMCPGGYLLNAATEPGGVVTNGMSNARRRGRFSNAAIVVNVEGADLEGDDALRGLRWRRELEAAAARAANPRGCHALPAQRLEDFLARRPPSALPRSSSFVPLRPAPLHELLPGFVCAAMQLGLERWGRQLRGLVGPEALLVGVESRTSSAVRILRDEASRQSPTVAGLYPVGEGAGYAGGITSSAADGIAAAEALLGELPLA